MEKENTNLYLDFLRESVENHYRNSDYELSEEELDSLVGMAAYKVSINKELNDMLFNVIHDTCETEYNKTIKKLRECKFDVPEKGDVTVETESDGKIVLKTDYPVKGEISVQFNGSSFPAYWAMGGVKPSKEEISNMLHWLLENLPAFEPIEYPFVQIWRMGLKFWYEAGFEDRDLIRLEKILEGYYDDELTVEELDMCKAAYKDRMGIRSFRNIWPFWIKQVLDFSKNENSSEPDKMNGNVTVLLKNGEELTINIDASKWEKMYKVKGKHPLYWKVHGWHSIDKAFPMFSVGDNEKIEKYLLEKYPIN